MSRIAVVFLALVFVVGAAEEKRVSRISQNPPVPNKPVKPNRYARQKPHVAKNAAQASQRKPKATNKPRWGVAHGGRTVRRASR